MVTFTLAVVSAKGMTSSVTNLKYVSETVSYSTLRLAPAPGLIMIPRVLGIRLAAMRLSMTVMSSGPYCVPSWTTSTGAGVLAT